MLTFCFCSMLTFCFQTQQKFVSFKRKILARKMKNHRFAQRFGLRGLLTSPSVLFFQNPLFFFLPGKAFPGNLPFSLPKSVRVLISFAHLFTLCFGAVIDLQVDHFRHVECALLLFYFFHSFFWIFSNTFPWRVNGIALFISCTWLNSGVDLLSSKN